jgi:hypothetical protein
MQRENHILEYPLSIAIVTASDLQPQGWIPCPHGPPEKAFRSYGDSRRGSQQNHDSNQHPAAPKPPEALGAFAVL